MMDDFVNKELYDSNQNEMNDEKKRGLDEEEAYK